MKTRTILACAVVLPMLVGCGAKYGKLTRRYHTASDSLLASNRIGDWVAIDGYFFQVEEPLKTNPVYKTIFDFPATVQKQLITEYTKGTSTPEELQATIATSFKPKEASVDDIQFEDRTVFKKRFVATVRNKSYYPADRIWKLYIRLIKEDSALRFASTSVIATDFETTDVGKLGYTTESNFKTNLTAGSGATLSVDKKNTTSDDIEQEDKVTNSSRTASTGNDKESGSGSKIENKVGGEVGYSNDFKMSEEVLLKQRYVKLSGSVKKRIFSLYQESTSGIDLSGNIIADVELRNGDTDPTETTSQRVFVFSNLSSQTITPATKTAPAVTATAVSEPKDIHSREIVVVYPLVKGDIYGHIEFEAVVRKVKSKSRTITEADDGVVFVHGTFADIQSKPDILILSKREVTPNFWEISNATRNPIRIKLISTGTEEDLRFRTLEDARNFLGWMKTKAAEVVAAGGVIGKDYEINAGAGVPALSVTAISNWSVTLK